MSALFTAIFPTRAIGPCLAALAVVLLVLAPCATAKLITEDLSGLRMVHIEVEVFEVAHRDGSDLGVDWRWRQRSGSPGDLLDSVMRAPIGTNEQGNLTVSVLDLKYGVLTASVRAAVERGYARLLSRPTLVTKDGVAASVASGEEIPFTVMSTIANTMPQGLVTQYRQTGVALQVTPRILPPMETELNGEPHTVQKIALSLRPSVSDIIRIERLETMEAGEKKIYDLPVVAQRSVESVVHVRDGQTLVLGGLLEERYDERQQGVPYLKNVPILGHAFKSTQRKSMTTEIIMYVTPTIVDPKQHFNLNERGQAITAAPSQPTDDAAAIAALAEYAIQRMDEQDGALSTRNEMAAASETAGTGRQAPSSSLVVVRNTRTFVENGGDTQFLGRNSKIIATGHVSNRSSARVRDVMVEAELYTDLGDLVDVVSRRVGTIRAGEERAFRLEFSNFDEHFNNVYTAHEVRYKTYFNY